MRQRIINNNSGESGSSKEDNKPLLEAPRQKLQSIKRKLLAKFEETPIWARSEYILDGYRQTTNSYIECFKSLFYIHNETGNVYSHGIGAIIFIVLAVSTFYLMSHHSTETKWNINWQDYIVLYSYIFCAICCLVLSTCFHLFLCHKDDKPFWNACDLSGIVMLICASFYPIINYIFFCEQFYKLLYIISITALGVATMIQCTSTYFSQEKFRLLRTLSFMFLAFTGLVPITHYFIKVGIIRAIEYAPMKYIGYMALFYIAGALIYLYRLPERFFPGKFDYWFHSHQIFHVFVVIAALFHFNGVLESFHIHHSSFQGCFN